MREEEETATLALRLSCLEDHLSVLLCAERLFDDIRVYVVQTPQVSKDVWSIFSYIDVFIDNESVILDGEEQLISFTSISVIKESILVNC
jgi:hypothetical protein